VESRTKFGSLGRAEVVRGWEKARDRRRKRENRRKRRRELGEEEDPKLLVKSPLMELFTIQANRKKSIGKFMEQFKS